MIQNVCTAEKEDIKRDGEPTSMRVDECKGGHNESSFDQAKWPSTRKRKT
jgi:hypothetical protein